MREQASAGKKEWLGGDFRGLVFLSILFIVQGIWIGFIFIVFPTITKNKLTSFGIGTIVASMWIISFFVKFLFSPIVDTKYFKFLGKRRTWIVPTQMISGFLMLYLSYNLEYYLENKLLNTIWCLFSFVQIMFSIQNIAMVGWGVTKVKEENLSYAATAHIVGFSLGSFISSRIYFALNSVEFGNKYIYFTKQFQPILNESNYLMYVAFFIFAISLYTLIFSNEKNDRIQFEEHDEIVSVIENLKICFKFLQNEQAKILILFLLCQTLIWSFQYYFGEYTQPIYIENKHEKFSFIYKLEFPIELAASFVISICMKSYGFGFFYWLVIAKICINLIYFNVVFSYLTGSAFDIMLLVTLFLNNFLSFGMIIATIAYANIIGDPKVASTLVTLIFLIANLVKAIPMFCSWHIIDKYGVYIPNLIGCSLTLAVFVYFFPIFNDPIMNEKISIDSEHLKND